MRQLIPAMESSSDAAVEAWYLVDDAAVAGVGGDAARIGGGALMARLRGLGGRVGAERGPCVTSGRVVG